MLRSAIAGCLLMLIASAAAFGQDEKPLIVSICELQKHPDAYNQKLVQIQGTVSHEFEDFSIHDARCPDIRNGPWLMYGGDVPDDVTYCCNGAGNKNRVEIEEIEVPLKKDQVLARFRRLLNSYRIDKKAKVHYAQTDPTFSVTATLMGRFFAGRNPGKAGFGRGFGHLGCCTLLVIEQVLSIDRVASNLKPGEWNCSTNGWHENRGADALAAAQKQIAESPEKWRMKDPRRVAAEALSRFLNGSSNALVFQGCKSKHLTYPDKKNDQYLTRCNWISNSSSDSYTVEAMKYYFLKRPSNTWKNIAWIPYEISHQHCTESSEP
jgi:hypothetical protein